MRAVLDKQTKNELLILLWLLLFRVPGTRSGDVCSIVALAMKLVLSWLDLLLCTNHTHTP